MVIGGGEHAQVVMNAALEQPDRWQLVGFVDPILRKETSEKFHLRQFKNEELVIQEFPGVKFVIGIGRRDAFQLKRQIDKHLSQLGATFATIIHPRAYVSSFSQIGDGTVVLANAIVNTNARIGRHVIVNSSAIVEHDVVIGDFSVLASAATLGGGTIVGENCYLGLQCCVRDHVVISNGVTIGMVATVIRSCESNKTYIGCPANARETDK